MNRKALYFPLIIILLLLIFTPACSQISDLTKPSSVVKPGIVRQAELGSKWMMNQIQIEVPAGEEIQILLKLADKDQADGYFYVEKGDDIEFQIMADSLVYESKGDNPKTPGRVKSDRFTFTATKALGSTYALIFRNTTEASKKTKTSIFAEIIYPVTGSMYVPVENNK